MQKILAFHGCQATVKPRLEPWNPIGVEEHLAVSNFMASERVLSGFHGSARPTFFGGSQVQALENAWSDRFLVSHSITVNSATSGLIAAMGAIGIKPGDEVIVPPYSMSSTAIAPMVYGGVPKFVDIDNEYFCINPEKVQEAITSSTKAIIAVNLFGHPAELRLLREIADKHGLFLIEDNAQAILAEEHNRLAGTVGHIGVYSLNIHKHIQAGEGGVCVTEDAELAKRMQLIRNHGENVTDWLDVKDLTNMVGFNFRMTEITATIALSQLAKVDQLVNRVEDMCYQLTEGLSNFPGVTVGKTRPNCRHNFYMFSMKYDCKTVGVSRELFSKALSAEGFPTACGYVKPIYQLPLFQRSSCLEDQNSQAMALNADVACKVTACPVTEAMYRDYLIQFQPVSWSVDDSQLAKMIQAFQKVYDNVKSLRTNGS
jgi:perosamine synthetase